MDGPHILLMSWVFDNFWNPVSFFSKTEDAALITGTAGILSGRGKEQVVVRWWAESVAEEQAFRTQSIKYRW